MTAPRSSHTAIHAVVAAGPHPASWTIELRGPLDPAALHHVLGELTPDDHPIRPGWQHRWSRHGPDHHTLRLTATTGTPAASVVGRIADLLTRPPAPARPLAPAQCAALARPGAPRYEAVSIEPAATPDPATVREALRAVVAAHPQLRSRLTAAGLLTEGAGSGGAERAGSGPDPLVETEFTDEADFTAAVDSTGRTLDAHHGIHLRALLARDRRPAGPRADRLAVIVHETAVDAASWRILLDDLTAALSTAAAGAPTRPRRGPDGLADWTARLRRLAHDPAEVRHWTLVADRRSRAATRRPTPPPGTTAPGTRTTAADTGHHTGYSLAPHLTRRITHDLAHRLTLTTGQVLTGAFALALARWQHTDEVDFDVRGDPRTGHQNLSRQVARLTEPHPVHLTPDPALDPLGQLAALAGPLAAADGHATGGAGFGACREWSPDPLLRTALRHLTPAPTCLTLPTPAEHLPEHAHPVPGTAPGRPTHRLHTRAHLTGGRLHIDLDWTADPAEGITDTTAATLATLLREVLEELAATATAPLPAVFRATPQQWALYTGGDAHPGTGRHVEQLLWAWHGPLDLERFTTAWQSVYDRETILRTAFTGGPEPHLMVHHRATPEITRHTRHDDDWPTLLERDRLCGFDLRCPAAMRLTLVETRENPPATAPTRIVLTYHRALLDNWSAHILLREFHRAYLAGGTLPGGERRPDLRDYTAWIAAQDLEPTRGFWTRRTPPDGAATRPGRPAPATGLTGVGRTRLRLDPARTTRLARWAGTWGTTESSVLHAVWAMLIHRASGAAAPAPVRFSVTVPGRGIPLDGAARMPGPLRNTLPMSVEVDPAATVSGLLRHLRDRALDMAAYEWVPGDWIRARARHGPGADPAGTVIVFEDPPHPVEGLEEELAAHGIRAEFSGTVPARSVLPIGLLAHHDAAGGLVLTAVHDRALLDEEAAAELLAQSAELLRELPSRAGESTTVAQALDLLAGRPVPRMADTPEPGPDHPLVTLRPPRRAQAGAICLIPPPDTPPTCYDLLSRTYPGPQELLLLTTGADGARPALAAHGTGRPLLLGGFSGAGSLACAIAERLAADGARPPRVVLAGTCPDERVRTRDLALALHRAAAPRA